MSVVVSLRDVIDEVDTLSDTVYGFINRKTGEVCSVSDEEIGIVEREAESEEDDEEAEEEWIPDWQKPVIEKARQIRDCDDWLELPSMRDFHEWELMERFCRSVENDLLREDLLDAIRGSGAFGRFKGMIQRHGLAEKWYRYRDQELAEFVASWLRKQGIAYKE